MGSIPVVGSSRNTTGGSPSNAIAVLNFLLLPPLGEKTVDESVNTFQYMYMYIKHNNYLVVAKLVRVPAFQHSSFVKVVGVH